MKTTAEDPSNQEFLRTYKLNASGVPGAKPIQTLPIRNALRQFVILLNGKFAYGFYSWSMPDPSTGNTGYAGDAVLFTINHDGAADQHKEGSGQLLPE